MTIYLGDKGHVEIGRQQTNEPLFSTLVPADVSVESKRFSVDYAQGALITGDSISIRRISATGTDQDLELVAGHNYPDWAGFCHVDAIGGIRLYRDFADAIDGKKAAALDLVKPTSEIQELKIETRSQDVRCLAQVRSYEISTERETVDITVLSNQFRNQLKNGLITGQGRLECFWEHSIGLCETSEKRSEFSAYLAKLCVRLQQGAGFDGKFILFDGGATDSSVWYESECVVTNVTVAVSVEQIIESSIEFVTTGPVLLKTGSRTENLALVTCPTHDGKRKIQLLLLFLVCPTVEKSIAGDKLVPIKEKCPRHWLQIFQKS